MRITRHGSAANHGPQELNLPQPTFEWSHEAKSLKIHHGRAKDFSGGAHHSYDIAISREELCAILSALATAAGSNPRDFEGSFASANNVFQRLHFISGGLYRVGANDDVA